MTYKDAAAYYQNVCEQIEEIESNIKVLAELVEARTTGKYGYGVDGLITCARATAIANQLMAWQNHLESLLEKEIK